jgi:hypothetical protein
MPVQVPSGGRDLRRSPVSEQCTPTSLDFGKKVAEFLFFDLEVVFG